MNEKIVNGKLFFYAKQGSRKYPQIMVLQKIDSKNVKCAYVFSFQQRNTQMIVIDNEKKYVDYTNILTVETNRLIDTEKCLRKPDPIIDKVFENNKIFLKKEKLKKRKRIKVARRKKEERIIHQMLDECRPAEKEKTKNVGSVGWYMTHPMQGGRTSPR